MLAPFSTSTRKEGRLASVALAAFALAFTFLTVLPVRDLPRVVLQTSTDVKSVVTPPHAHIGAAPARAQQRSNLACPTSASISNHDDSREDRPRRLKKPAPTQEQQTSWTSRKRCGQTRWTSRSLDLQKRIEASSLTRGDAQSLPRIPRRANLHLGRQQ